MAYKNTSAKNIINLDSIFPIKTHGELESLETKIKADENFKNTLITQLSVLIDVIDLGNSVRRIVSRMLSDVLLSEYSLYGFKSKLCFSSSNCYRVIIDAIRVNVKYSVVPEKEIDNLLGIWLSHAPFRIKKAISKTRKTLQNSFFNLILIVMYYSLNYIHQYCYYIINIFFNLSIVSFKLTIFYLLFIIYNVVNII
uniref:DUF4806 domain-containing protein n=1 Tax=Sipha flava TaxID=143950 RepID=A0A2S2QR09_9HEMI